MTSFQVTFQVMGHHNAAGIFRSEQPLAEVVNGAGPLNTCSVTPQHLHLLCRVMVSTWRQSSQAFCTTTRFVVRMCLLISGALLACRRLSRSKKMNLGLRSSTSSPFFITSYLMPSHLSVKIWDKLVQYRTNISHLKMTRLADPILSHNYWEGWQHPSPLSRS